MGYILVDKSKSTFLNHSVVVSWNIRISMQDASDSKDNSVHIEDIYLHFLLLQLLHSNFSEF